MRSRCTASWMLVVVLLAFLLTVSSVCGQNSSENVVEPKQNTLDLLQANLASVNQVSDSVTNLAQKIARSIASPDSKTEIFSPVSIAGALSLLLLGAGGQTEQELRSVMGFNESQLSPQQIHQTFGRLFQDLVTNDPSLEPLVSWRVNDKCNQNDEEDEYEDFELDNTTDKNTSPSHLISVANGMFLQDGLKPADRFLADVQRYYQSSVENLDFEHDPDGAAVSINEWCARETHGKIKEMVTGQTVSNTHMIIASALYFKAQWETTFSPYATRPRPFYLSGRQEPSISVETMATTGCFPYYDATAQLDAKIIGLPYETGNSTMYIVLPNESTREKLQQLQANLDAAQVNMMIDQMVTKNGMVMLPKLSISNSVQLSSVLQHLGVHDLFDPTRSNLTRVLDETVSQTDTQQETSIQQPDSAMPTDQPVASNGDTPASTAVAEDPVTTTVRTMTKRETKSSAEQEVTLVPEERQPVSEQPTDGSLLQPTQPQSLEPSTLGQSMTFPFNISVCNQVENCEYTEAHGCTCTIVPTNDDAAECGKHVARYVDDSKGRMCIISTGNDEIGRKFICIKRSYCWSNLQSACERNACHFFRNQCYCCERNLTSPSFVQDSQITETTSTPRSDGVVSTSPTSIEDDEDQRLQPLQQGDIKNRLDPDEPVQAQQPLFVNEVITQVKLDVNEQGTEGGAVTLALIDRIGPGYTFHVDGPFLILIRHDITKALLFYGAVHDPRP